MQTECNSSKTPTEHSPAKTAHVAQKKNNKKVIYFGKTETVPITYSYNAKNKFKSQLQE